MSSPCFHPNCQELGYCMVAKIRERDAEAAALLDAPSVLGTVVEAAMSAPPFSVTPGPVETTDPAVDQVIEELTELAEVLQIETDDQEVTDFHHELVKRYLDTRRMDVEEFATNASTSTRKGPPPTIDFSKVQVSIGPEQERQSRSVVDEGAMALRELARLELHVMIAHQIQQRPFSAPVLDVMDLLDDLGLIPDKPGAGWTEIMEEMGDDV